MVDHDHNRIKPRKEREGGDEINRELFEGERNRGQDRTERGNSRISVDLVLLANSTTCNEMLDNSGKAQPPEVALNDRLGVEDSHVPREGGRVNRMEEGRAGRGRNIHPVVKVKMTIIKCPVREGGMSEQRGPLI